MPANGDRADALLAQLGYEHFRPGQREAVEAAMEGRDSLIVMPTGGGKSLCYQLPGLASEDLTIVVSPLIALMNDQWKRLSAAGHPVAMISSGMSEEAARSALDAVRDGRARIVYCSPERFASPVFLDALAQRRIDLLAVDEAHCVSEWGHDFRPDYLRLPQIAERLGRPTVMACTATATKAVATEVAARFEMRDPLQVRSGFDRPNLSFDVVRLEGKGSKARRLALLECGLAEAGNRPAIVYCGTRRDTDDVAEALRATGLRAVAYHAGMEPEARTSTQQRFMSGEAEVIVATNAFGMGIDRADVRAVIHLGPPSSIEAYYQEVGRAGRDGADALGLLLISSRDLPLRRALIERPAEGAAAPDTAVVEHKWGLFLELIRWAEGGSCRHDAILRYFGDEAETLHGCGRCDVCRALGDESPTQDPEAVSLFVRKALSGVARAHGRFGLQTVVALIHGDPDQRLERSGLAATPTFGNLREHPREWLTRLLRRCVTAGWVSFRGADRPVVILTEEGRAVMKGNRPARLLLPAAATERVSAHDARPPRRAGPTRAAGIEELDDAGQALFQALRAWRLTVAREASIAPFMVASDRTLRDIARLRPRTPEELAMAYGIGRQKAERYGLAVLRVVAEATRA